MIQVKKLKCIKKVYITLVMIIITLPAFSQEIHRTFDPYEDSGAGDKITNESLIFPTMKRVEISSGMIYTKRTGFEDKEMNESNYYSYLSLSYRFTESLAAGLSVPYIFVRFEDSYEISYNNGIGDIQSFISYSLPRSLPVFCSAAFTLQLPTGNYDKYLGVGEFSFGFSLNVYKYFSLFYVGASGSYFINNDPPGVDLPDTKMIGVTGGMNFSNNISLGLTFDLYNTTLISRKEVIARQVKASFGYTWHETVSANLTFTYEFYPTTAYIPGIALSYCF